MTPVGKILVSLLDGAHLDLTLPELLCRRAAEALPVSGVSITLVDELARTRPLAGSDERAATLMRRQLELGVGPCFDVVRTGRLQQVADLADGASARWPVFADLAVEAGIHALMSFPLQVGGIRLGVLDLYRESTGSLDDGDLARALHHVDAAVLILLHLQEMWEADLDGGWVDEVVDGTLHGHPEVHQATGMVSVQADVSLAQALLLLRARAFAEERSLTHVATEVVERRLRFDRDALMPPGEEGG